MRCAANDGNICECDWTSFHGYFECRVLNGGTSAGLPLLPLASAGLSLSLRVDASPTSQSLPGDVLLADLSWG